MELVTYTAPTKDPQVTLAQGTLLGKNLTSRCGKNICTFQGIPYAKPPVGDLRFKPPQEAPTWTGIREAKKVGPKCIQINSTTNECVGKEDCLYINVYTPQMKRVGTGLSVMVWVHGGGFYGSSGDTEMYGPELLLDHDVVLVTFNYRIGAFGFLSLGTKEAPGNYGLKDQVAALQWVQKNIADFGGNPDCVTIFGGSAGGVSVHYLMLSPLSRGLFHRAIVQSGSVHNPWAMQRNPKRNGLEAAAMLGCREADDISTLKNLHEIDAQKLAKLEIYIRLMKNTLAFFVPVIEPKGTEGAFLTEDPRLMLARGNISNVPLMAGFTTHEGIMEVGTLMMKRVTPEEDLKLNFSRYVPTELGFKDHSPQSLAVWRDILNFYKALTTNDITETHILLNTDVEIFLGVDELVRGMAALRRKPVFYYQFSYDGGLGLIKKVTNIKHKGSCHADEVGYLFTRKLIPDELKHASSADRVTIDRMTKLWTDFAKTGTPTPSDILGVTWTAVEAPLYKPNLAATHYLDIGEQLTMKKETLKPQQIEFWQNLNSKYQTYNTRGKL